MHEKNSSGWFLHEVMRLSSGRLTPVRVIACSPPFEVHILVEQYDPDSIEATERLLSAEVAVGTRVRLVSQQSYDSDVRFMREAFAAAELG